MDNDFDDSPVLAVRHAITRGVLRETLAAPWAAQVPLVTQGAAILVLTLCEKGGV